MAPQAQCAIGCIFCVSLSEERQGVNGALDVAVLVFLFKCISAPCVSDAVETQLTLPA